MPKSKQEQLAEFEEGLLKKMRDQNRKDTEEIVNRVVGTFKVPDGYTKCASCGRFIPIDLANDCPYCKPEDDTKPEGKDEGIGGILDILEDDED